MLPSLAKPIGTKIHRLAAILSGTPVRNTAPVPGRVRIDKANMLLVFAGMWAMKEGLLDIMRSFQIRMLGKIATDF
jgi:hypothetical protein